MDIIEELLVGLESHIKLLIEEIDKKQEVLLVNNDIFKSIVNNINGLEKYNNKSLGALFAYYRVSLAHLNKTFCNKESIKQEEIDNIVTCLNDIKILKAKINVNSPFNVFFEDLKSVLRILKTIDINSEFTYNSVSPEVLKIYENTIIKYKSILNEINEIRMEIDINVFESLKLDLDIIYAGLKSNLNDIYIEILNSNDDIAEPLMNKLKRDVNDGNYEKILKTGMVNKEINNYQRRCDLAHNLEMLVESLNSIINKYKFSKLDKSNTNIDVEYVDNGNNYNYDIDIPQFIEDNYEEKRSNSSEESTIYDRKITAFITRFEILKRKLERKKSLTKEEVKLYNKLESKLDAIKSGKSNAFISGIRFNHYFKLLNKKIKLYRKNSFKKVNVRNKKRK